MSNLPNWGEIYCTGLGLLYVGLSNYASTRPIISRLPRYAVFGAAGFFVGKFLEQKYHRRVIEKEHVILDYIKSHPEDFPEYQPRYYKDILETWHPVR